MNEELIAERVIRICKPRLMQLIATSAVSFNKDEQWAKIVLNNSLAGITKLVLENKLILVEKE